MSEQNTSAQIIELYRQGYSSKDICLVCNVPVLTVRKCLREAGFNTRNYRKVSDTNKEKVLLLINAGYSYSKIEVLLNVSVHVIREIVMSTGYLGSISNYHPPVALLIKKQDISISKNDSLKRLYCSGNFGLAKCAQKIGLSDNDFLWFVYHLSEEEKEMHCKNLKANINRLYEAQMPVTAIAKRLDISPSLVKKYLIYKK